MANSLQEMSNALLRAASAAGAEQADVIVLRGSSVSVDVRNRALEQAERAEGIDLGLRVLIGRRQAIVSASDASAATMATMADRAVAMAQEAPEDPYVGLAATEQLASDTDLLNLELEDPAPEPSPGDLTQDARSAEAAALEVAGVTQLDSASASYGRTEVHVAASNGFSSGYARTSRSTYCVAISGEGTEMERDYESDSRIFQSDLRDPAEIGQVAAERAVARSGARKPKTGVFPVLYDERISSSLIGHLLSAVNGATIARGGSWLQDALGEPVLPDHVSLHEDPHRKRVPGSRPFDAEGLATHPRDIVQKGRLTGWTLDLASARKLEQAPTGNAARGPSSAPMPSSWNVTLTPGHASRQDLIRDMGTGLLVTSMIGSTINPTTGDYSRGASGFWVENGEITHAVNECTVAGNLRDMLRRIVPANDARPYLSRVVPSLLIEGMALAGD